jgi:hypothetical protein
VFGQEGQQAALDFRKGLVPAGRHQFTIAAHEWRAQAVGVFVQVLQRVALGADLAVAADIVVGASDAGDLRAVCAHPEPAVASHSGQLRWRMHSTSGFAGLSMARLLGAVGTMLPMQEAALSFAATCLRTSA